jgi:predicted nucleic acid-binding protein
MSPAPRASRHSRGTIRSDGFRYTIDASVFVNAFNTHERGHAESLRILTVIHEDGDPIIVPTILVTEIASAVARASDDSAGALRYARAAAALPHLTLVALTAAMARRAAELAATYRLRGADAVYLAVARRYATTLISRDGEQLTRGSRVAVCHTPEQALRDR